MVASYQGKLMEPVKETYPITESFMSRSFVTVKPDTDIYEAMDILLENRISGAMVVDDFGTLVGFISEKDCLKLTTSDSYEQSQHGGPVAQYMTRRVVTIHTNMGLAQVAQTFLKHPFRKLPVMERNRLVGVVRRRDVLEAIQDFFGKRTEYMRKH